MAQVDSSSATGQRDVGVLVAVARRAGRGGSEGQRLRGRLRDDRKHVRRPHADRSAIRGQSNPAGRSQWRKRAPRGAPPNPKAVRRRLTGRSQCSCRCPNVAVQLKDLAASIIAGQPVDRRRADSRCRCRRGLSTRGTTYQIFQPPPRVRRQEIAVRDQVGGGEGWRRGQDGRSALPHRPTASPLLAASIFWVCAARRGGAGRPFLIIYRAGQTPA